MKKITKILSVCILLFLFCSIQVPAKATAAESDFHMNVRIVWMEKNAAGYDHTYTWAYHGSSDTPYIMKAGKIFVLVDEYWQDYEYTPEDFPDINCIAVEKIGAPGSFMLTLADTSADYILRAAGILEARQDVLAAEPSGYTYITGSNPSLDNMKPTDTGFGFFPPMDAFANAEKVYIIWDEVYRNESQRRSYMVEIDPNAVISENSLTIALHPAYSDGEYTPEDFPYINCTAVEETASPDGQLRYLTLKLGDTGAQYVWRAIGILNDREDVILAEPNHLPVEDGSPDTGDPTLIPMVTVTLFSGACMAVLVLRKKKIG